MNGAATRAAVAFALQVPAWLLVVRGGPTALLGGALTLGVLVAARRGGGGRPALLTRFAVEVLLLCVGLATLFALPGPRARFGLVVTVCGLCLALPRLLWSLNALRMVTALGLGLVALMGLARMATRASFGIAVAAYLAAGVVAMITADRAWAPLLRHRRDLLAPLALGLGVAAGVMAGVGWALPAAEPAVAQALQPYLFGSATGSSGFGDGRMRLGDIGKVVTSDEVVMRVYGSLDYLRGQTYVNYFRGSWSTRTPPGFDPTRVEAGVIALGAAAGQGDPVLIEAEPEAGGALFAPLGAAAVTEAPDGSTLDAYGVLLVPPELVTEPRSWRVQPGDPAARTLEAPSDRDLIVRDHRFKRLARAWVGDARTDRERVARLADHLSRTFTYTLDVGLPPENEEPVYWFLAERRAGHCEYFASGLALLARSLGIPARVIAGYRVFEHNPLGGYWIVRKRDAHAWVEVALDGQWEAFDPTPPGSLEGEHRGVATWLGARIDLARRWFWATLERLGSLTAQELLAAAAGVSTLLLLFVWVRRRSGAAPAVVAGTEAYPPLTRLEAWLGGEAALGRPASEPLEAWADRLRAGGRAEAAAVVEACAAWRYGALGDPAVLEARVSRLVSGRADEEAVSSS